MWDVSGGKMTYSSKYNGWSIHYSSNPIQTQTQAHSCVSYACERPASSTYSPRSHILHFAYASF